jgi:Fe-S-cluster containining protein
MEKQVDYLSLCLKCRYCCTVIAFRISPIDPNGIEFYTARGFKIIHSVGKGETWVVVPHICPKLTENGCSIYSKRPYSCVVFDGRKHPTTEKKCLWPKSS